jgi:NADPH:quinone reductase-like Zn-dependent oxidoreductase
VATTGGDPPLVFRDAPDPTPLDDEILIEMRAGSLDRGELRLNESRPERDRQVRGKVVFTVDPA